MTVRNRTETHSRVGGDGDRDRAYSYDTELHNGDEQAVCVGQWCCGCAEHPIGKPWGWNFTAWDRHYAEAHR